MYGKELKDIYPYKTDIHVHTSPVSKCAELSPHDTVNLYKEAGVDSIVITNHFFRGNFDGERGKTKKEHISFYLNDYKEVKAYGKAAGLDVILGLEIRFTENVNDYLVYGVTEKDVSRAYDYIDGEYPAFYKEFKNSSNIILQAHPFRNGMVLQDPAILDGIEVYNMHPHHNGRAAVAAKFARLHPELIVTGGTDFHHPDHQAMCLIRTKERVKTSKQLARILKSRDFIFDIWGDIIIPNGR